MRVRLAWAIVVVSMIAWPPVVLTQSIEQHANALARRLMSPYCPGLLLADCRSEGARELRAEILYRLKGGGGSDAIERDLIARFGPAIRTEPEFSGIGLIVWLGPLVLGLAGLGIVVILVRRAAPRDPSSDSFEHDESQRDASISERLQDELDALD